MLEKRFKLSANNTTVKTEIIAGLTTFMTMAYIIALNPNLLTNYGAGGQELWNGVFLATCLSSAVAMFVLAFLANKPFCLAPGMGLNSFMAIVIGNLVAMTGMGYAASPAAAGPATTAPASPSNAKWPAPPACASPFRTWQMKN